MFKDFESVVKKKKKFFGKQSLNTIGSLPGVFSQPNYEGLFISEWIIGDEYSGKNISLPYDPQGFYTGTIDWGDGNITSNTFDNSNHTYSSNGKYRIVINGYVTGFKFKDTKDKISISKIINWGFLRGINNSNESMFEGCTFLKINDVVDELNLDGITATTNMFKDCVLIDKINNIENWNFSTVKNTVGMFNNAKKFNDEVGGWDVSNVTNMTQMFSGASNFDKYLGNWDIKSLTNATDMLDLCGMSVLNYSDTLIGWSENINIQSNVPFGAKSIYYSDYAIYARNYLTGVTKNWLITEDLRAPLIIKISTNQNFTLPYVISGNYSGTIDWGDGITSGNTFNNRSHSYTNSGIYEIKIYGNVVGFKFNNTGDKSKIIEILQWGPLRGLNNSNDNMFYGCNNLTINNVSDIIHISGVTNTSNMFLNAASLTTIKNLNRWNLSKTQNLSSMFLNAINFNQSLNTWNISAATNMGGILQNTNLSVTNYSLILVDWAALPILQNNVSFGANNLQYNSEASPSRNILTTNYNWVIQDSGPA